MEEPKGGNNFKHIFKTKPKNGKNEKILKVCLVTTFENMFLKIIFEIYFLIFCKTKVCLKPKIFLTYF